MNKMNKIGWLTTAFILFALTIFPVKDAEAQWSIGASYEVRDDDPTNGFGVRLERSILQRLPIIDLSLRAHFSLFNETIEGVGDAQVVTQELQAYDFGLAALAGLNVGLVKPYAGLGLGSESFEITRPTVNESFDESSLYWNLLAGAELSILGPLRPFIEYRFTRLFDDDLFGDDFDYRQNGRLAVGLSINL